MNSWRDNLIQARVRRAGVTTPSEAAELLDGACALITQAMIGSDESWDSPDLNEAVFALADLKRLAQVPTSASHALQAKAVRAFEVLLVTRGVTPSALAIDEQIDQGLRGAVLTAAPGDWGSMPVLYSAVAECMSLALDLGDKSAQSKAEAAHRWMEQIQRNDRWLSPDQFRVRQAGQAIRAFSARYLEVRTMARARRPA